MGEVGFQTLKNIVIQKRLEKTFFRSETIHNKRVSLKVDISQIELVIYAVNIQVTG